MKIDLKIVAIIVIVLAFIGGVTAFIYLNPRTNNFQNSGTPKRDIIMFMDPKSKDSIKMLEILGRENSLDKISIIDVSSKEGLGIVKESNIDISILPYFVNTVNGKTSSGLKKGMDELKRHTK